MHQKLQDIWFCALQTSWRSLSSTSKASRPFVHYKQVKQHITTFKTFYFVQYRHVVYSCPAHQKHQDIYFVHCRHVGDRCSACHNPQDIFWGTLRTSCRSLSSASKTLRHMITYITDKLEIVVPHIENIKTFRPACITFKTFYFVHYRQVGYCCPVHRKHQDILLCTLQTSWRSWPSVRHFHSMHYTGAGHCHLAHRDL